MPRKHGAFLRAERAIRHGRRSVVIQRICVSERAARHPSALAEDAEFQRGHQPAADIGMRFQRLPPIPQQQKDFLHHVIERIRVFIRIQQAAADAEQQIHVLPIDLFKPCALLHVCRPPFRLHAFLDYNPFGAGCEGQVFAEIVLWETARLQLLGARKKPSSVTPDGFHSVQFSSAYQRQRPRRAGRFPDPARCGRADLRRHRRRRSDGNSALITTNRGAVCAFIG